MKIFNRYILFFCFIWICFVPVAFADKGFPYQAIDLEEIVVTASQVKSKYQSLTQNVSVVNAQDSVLEEANEISAVLDTLPAVDIIEYGSMGSTRVIHTRGVSAHQVITLIDGRSVNTPRDGVTDFNQIPLSNVKRIEFLRGPASSIYGANAIGGVINIITKEPEEKMCAVLINKWSSFRTIQSSFSQSQKKGKLDYLINYDYATSHGHRNNSDYLSHNLGTKFGYQINHDSKLILSSGYYTAETGVPGQIWQQDLDDRQETKKKYFDATYKYSFADGGDLTVKLFHNLDRLEFVESYQPLNKDAHQTEIYGVNCQVSRYFFDFLRVSLGGNLADNLLNSSTSGKHSYDFKALYLESELEFLSHGSIKTGARWDKYSNFGERISPSVSFHYWFTEYLKMHALIARAFRAPTFNDLYWPRQQWSAGGVEGNPNLGPEKALSYEAGLEFYWRKKFRSNLTFFNTDFDNLIEWTVNNNWWRPENISSAKIYGVEWEGEYTLLSNLKLDLSYMYLKAQNEDLEKELIYRPRHLYKLRAMYNPFKKWEFGLTGIYKSARFVDKNNTQSLEYHFSFNADAIFKISEAAHVFAEVKNLLDCDYQEEQGYPMPGRAYSLGVKITF